MGSSHSFGNQKLQKMASCTERFGDRVDALIAAAFHSVGLFVGNRPRTTILLAFVLTVIMGVGFTTWETENRAEELWVPQNTIAEAETEMYDEYFPSTSRFEQVIVQPRSGDNVLTKDSLLDAMAMHEEIATKNVTVDGEFYNLPSICTKAGGTCVQPVGEVCTCLISSILKQWNYDFATLEDDSDYMTTLNNYGTREDLEAVLGNAQFDESGLVVSAEAFSLSYFLQDQSEVVDGSEVDVVAETWEKDVFLATAESVPQTYPSISVDYISTRSFGDTFGEEISGDLMLVQISYIMAFLFLGANLGKVKCGTGSRWTMALGALFTVG